MTPKPPKPMRLWGEWLEYEVPDLIHRSHQGAESIRLVRNNRYQVLIVELEGGLTHLSLKNVENTPHGHDWRDMQRIKSELCGDEREAVELFPAESRVVDTSNQFHLWVMPEGETIPLGFHSGRAVSNQGEIPPEIRDLAGSLGITDAVLEEIAKKHRQRDRD